MAQLTLPSTTIVKQFQYLLTSYDSSSSQFHTSRRNGFWFGFMFEQTETGGQIVFNSSDVEPTSVSSWYAVTDTALRYSKAMFLVRIV